MYATLSRSFHSYLVKPQLEDFRILRVLQLLKNSELYVDKSSIVNFQSYGKDAICSQGLQ